MTQDAAKIVMLLEPIMAAQSLEEAAGAVALQVGAAVEAAAAGCFLVIHGRTFLSFWYPSDRLGSTPIGIYLERLARAAPHATPPIALRLPDGSELQPRVLVMPLKARLTAVLCLATPPQARSPYDGLLDGLAGLFAERLRAIQELEAERRRSGQYERWFRVADRQIRALDLERQKFAGLANAIPIGVFVADRDRVIRWINQPLVTHFPSRSEGRSWLGASCDQFCGQLGSPEATCVECIVTKVLETRRGAELIMDPTMEAGDVFHLTATPIANLEGLVQEVMVAVQRLPGAGGVGGSPEEAASVSPVLPVDPAPTDLAA
jgi:hypothetical protein